MVDLSKLKEITEEIAREIKDEENGKILSFLKLILDNIDTLSLITDKDSKILYFNKAESDYFKRFGITLHVGNFLYKDILGMDTSPDWCPIKKCIREKDVVTVEVDGKGPRKGHKFYITAIPLIFNGVSGAILFTKID